MKEDDSNWFSKWEQDLPLPEDLMPITQTLITPHLAIAFDIYRNPNHHHHQQQPPAISSQPNSSEFDSPELGGGGGSAATAGGGGGDEPARTLKRPRLVWTPQLHKRFVDAVAHLGIKNAVPKTIMQLMSVDGLTRENVASHLQKYRLYLKRMQGISSGGGGNASAGDPATDHLFASSPVPAHFLHQQGRPNSDHYLPYVPVAALQQQHHHHHHQMAAAAAAVAVTGHHPQLQQQPPRYGHFGSPRNGQFDQHSYVNRQSQQQVIHRVGTPIHNSDDLESANGRKVLTLFPTGDD